MANASRSLDMRIKAFIDGLAEVVGLRKELDSTATSASKVNAAFAGASSGQGLQNFGTQVEKVGKTLSKFGKEDAADFSNGATKITNGLGFTGTNVSGFLTSIDKLGSSLSKFGKQDAPTFTNGTNQAADALSKTSKALPGFGTEVDKIGENLKKFGKDSAPAFSDGAEKVNSGLSLTAKNLPGVGQAAGLLEGQIGSLIKIFVAFAGIAGIKALADTAARTETLGVTLGVVGRNAGYSQTQITGFEKELVKLGITTGAAREALTSLIQAGFSLTEVNEQGATTAGRLARAAQDLAVVTGENSSDTLKRLVVNIQQMDSMGLRYMGLLINIEAAQTKFAASIGKSADALTQQQKQQAVLNEVLVKSTALQGAYEESMDTVGKKAASLKRYQEELANTLGGKLLPAYSGLIDALTLFLSKSNDMAKTIDKNNVVSENFGASVRKAFNGVSDLLLNVGKFIGDIAPPIIAVANQVLNLTGVILSAAGTILNLGTSVDDAGKKVGIFAAIVNTLVVGIGLVITSVQDVVIVFGGALFLALGKATEGIGYFLSGLSKVVSLTNKEAGASLKKFADETLEMGRNMSGFGDEVLKSNSKTGEFLKQLTGGTDVIKNFGKGVSFKDLQTEITTLIGLQRDNKITNEEAATSYGLIENRIKELGAAGGISKNEIGALNGQLGQIPQKIADGFQKALQDLKLTMTELRTGVSSDASLIAGNLESLAQGIGSLTQTASADLAKAFQIKTENIKSFTDLNAIFQTLNKTTVAGKFNQDDFAETLTQTLVQSTALVDAEIKRAKSTEDLSKIVRILFEQQAAVTKQFSEGRISGEQFGDAMRLIGDQIEETKNATTRLKLELANIGLSAPLKELGTSLEKIKLGYTDAEQAAVQSFTQIANSGKLTGAELDKAFTAGLSKINSLQALGNFNQSLKDAAANGAITGKALDDANAKSIIKFDELFQAQLKSANTKGDFERLTQTVQLLAGTGELTGSKVALAMDAISKATNKAKSDVVALAEQLTAAQSAQTSVGQASVAVAQAQADAYRATSGVLRAQATYQRDSNALNAAAYQQAIAEQALAQDRLVQAKVKFDTEVAQYDVLIAKQRTLNLEKQAEGDAGNLSLQTQIAAQKEIEKQKTLDLENSRQLLEKSQQHTLETEKLVIQTKLQTDLIKDQIEIQNANTKATGDTAAAAGNVASNTSSALGSMQQFGAATQGVKTDMVNLSAATNSVAGVAAELGVKLGNVSQGAKDAMAQLAALRAQQQATGLLQNQVEGNPTPGIGTINNPISSDPFSTTNVFKDLNAKNATTSKTGPAVDNSGLESLLAKQKAASNGQYQYTAEDLKIAQTVKSVEDGNLATANKYATSYSFEGMNSVRARSRQAANVLSDIQNKLAQEAANTAAATARQTAAATAAAAASNAPSATTPSLSSLLPTQATPAAVAQPAATAVSNVAANSMSVAANSMSPVRVVQLDLNVGGNVTQAYVNEGDEQGLLAAIAEAQRRS